MPLKFNYSFIKRQQEPFYIFYPERLKKKIRIFNENFSGEVLYAVKANPSKFIIEILLKKGINSFDVASLNEVKLIKKISPNAKIFFMNPVKSRNSIKKAYKNYNVRNFAIDSLDEIKKIQEETNFAKDLNIHLRLAIPNKFSAISLSNKFGVKEINAPQLLEYIKKEFFKVGICFHVGSQCMNPIAYKIAIEISKKIIKRSGVKINFFNIGGGFPVFYPGYKDFCLDDYFNQINDYILNLDDDNFLNTKLLAEPGRSIVSECMSMIVKVNLRKKNKLYINDGIYGSLNNAGYLGFNYPVKLFGREDKKSKFEPFIFYGPTCDSRDFMPGPFYLPDSINEGDWIEIEHMGAYTMTMKTKFNGFFEKYNVFTI